MVYSKVNKIYSTEQKFFTTKDLEDVLDIDNKRTFEQTIKRLKEEKILTKIERGKYLKSKSEYIKFEIAQFILTYTKRTIHRFYKRGWLSNSTSRKGHIRSNIYVYYR